MRTLILCITIVLATTLGQAQLLPLSGIIITSPEGPGPNQTITVSLQSHNFDANTATLEWYVDGVLFDKGVGKTSISIRTKSVGDVILIGLYAKVPDGRELRTASRITPQVTLLLHEAADSYTPPFYEGRSLPGEGGSVRVAAYPTFASDGKLIPPASLVYAWSVNDISFASLSGYGKRFMEFRQDDLNEENIVHLIVKTQSEDAASSKSVSIRPYPTTAALYLTDDVLGIQLEKTFGQSYVVKKPIKLSLVPYGFSYKSGDATITWSLGGAPATSEGDFLISLYPKENSTGSSVLRVQGSHRTKALQKFTTETNIVFDTRDE